MRRLSHQPDRKKRKGEAANEHRHTPRDNAHNTGTPQVNSSFPLPERLNLRGHKSSSLSSPLAPTPAAAATGLSSTPNSDHATGATLPHNDPHGRQPDTTSSGTNAAKKDYWQLAIDKLQKEDSLVADQIAGVQQAAAESGSSDFAAQLLHATKQSQQALEAKRWKITTSSGEVVLRDQLDRLLKVVTVFKDVGNAAGSLDPVHAGLPLAGFCVLMQIWPIPSSAQ
jgi:hypothetical protein